MRFNLRSMMIAVAVISLFFAWTIDQLRKGRPLVVFEYPVVVENEPLIHPIRLVAVETDDLVLQDGRKIRLENGPYYDGYFGFGDPGQTVYVDVETASDGLITVHGLKSSFVCGNCSRRGVLPLRIPLFARTVCWNHRSLVGTGRLVGRSSVTMNPSG